MLNELLVASDLFNGLSEASLTPIAQMARVEDHEKRSYLFIEGSEPQDLFIIIEGKIEMNLSLSPTPGIGYQIAVDTLGKGQTCGWSSVLESHVYTMTARCIEPVKAIAINGAQLRSFLDQNPSIGYRVMENMAWVVTSRLRNMKVRLPLALGRETKPR